MRGLNLLRLENEATGREGTTLLAVVEQGKKVSFPPHHIEINVSIGLECQSIAMSSGQIA